jgi:hypothetical protein
MSDRISIGIRRQMIDDVEDWLIQLRSERSGLASRMRFMLFHKDVLEKTGEAMAKNIAQALKVGYLAGMVAARCTPEMPLRPEDEWIVRDIAERPADWRDGFMEQFQKEDAAEGFVEIFELLE